MQIGAWQKALDDITKALSYSPDNVDFLIAKITAQLQIQKQRQTQKQIELIAQLESLYQKTTSRIILKKIAALYKEYGKITKYRNILQRLYMEDTLDIEVIDDILNSYERQNSERLVWETVSKITAEKIQRKKLPIEMKKQ